MPTSTTNYALKKIDLTDSPPDITVYNPNFDTIDTELKSLSDNKVDKVDGKQLSTNDYTATEKTKLAGIAAGAEVNQNTFANVKVGATTIAADTKTDTLEMVAGTGITLTPDATNDKVTIASQINNTLTSTSTTQSLSANQGKMLNDNLTTEISRVTTHLEDETKHKTTAEQTFLSATDNAKFKSGSSTFTDNDTSQTFTDAFCTVGSLVTIVITSGTPPQGAWSVGGTNGSFTITSTVAESADITFDYYIQKAVG